MVEPLFITDDELVKLLGVPEKDARARRVMTDATDSPQQYQWVGTTAHSPVMRADAIAPRSPGTTARMRPSMVSRSPETIIANRSRSPGRVGASLMAIDPTANPIAPMP